MTRPVTLAAILVLAAAPVAAQPRVADRIPPALKAEARALAAQCRVDVDLLCQGVRPGGGRILACLDANRTQLSPGCRDALSRADALRAAASAQGLSSY